MKRKTPTDSGPVVPQEILEGAKASAFPDQIPNLAKCVVCTADCAPNSTEGLCWVCRRLKISAWRDSEQLPAQE